MEKVKDRITLSLISGGIASIFGLLMDQIFVSRGLSKRSWPSTASGVWLSSKREGQTFWGQIFGIIMTMGMCILGALNFINILSRYGRDKWVLKGLFFGISFNAVINALTGGMINSKLKPKDAVTNLLYVLDGAVYGLVTAFIFVTLGHNSLFDANAWNNSAQPTEKTTEEVMFTKPISAK